MGALNQTHKISISLVQFTYGDPLAPSYLRLCDASSETVFNGQTFLPEPSCSLQLPTQGGGLEEEPCRIKLPLNRGAFPEVDAFLGNLAKPRAHAPVWVRIYELILAGTEDQQTLALFEGKLKLSRANPDGSNKVLELEFLPSKVLDLENIRLGIPANGNCVWTYGGLGCFAGILDVYSSGSSWTNWIGKGFRVWVNLLQSYSSRMVTAVIDPSRHPNGELEVITEQPRGWWIGGFLEKDGLRINIADNWYNTALNSNSNDFLLSKLPPSDWFAGAEILLWPGCPKTIAACRERAKTAQSNPGTGNEFHFGGFGHGIPAYHPIVEEDNR